MEENICCTIKNSELNVPKGKRAFLTYPTPGFCSCTLEEHEDGIALNFRPDGLEAAELVSKKSYAEKLRFLINAAELESCHIEYMFTLSLENLLVDLNLRPQVLSRDLNYGMTSFIQKYNALIGQVLFPKYSYEDYLSGGEDLLKKQKLLKELAELETVPEIKARLEEEHTEALNKTAATKKLVFKRNVVTARILIPVLAAALMAAAFFTVYAHIVEIPHRNQIIIASQAYIAGDYIAVQVALRDIPTSEMTYETKHLLARAFVTTQAMTDEMKDHILMGLTLIADEVLFDFWIYLGRLEFDSATEIAQWFMDSELLLWVYLKQVEFVRVDVAMPSDERLALLSRLESEITRLQNERDVGDGQ